MLNRIIPTIAVCACISLAGSHAAGASLHVDAFKYSDPAYETGVEVDLAGIAGVTGVQAVSAVGTPVSLAPLGPDLYAGKLGTFGTFGDFETETVGNWQLVISLAGGSAVYDFAVNAFAAPFEDGSFPPAPTMIYPTEGQAGMPQTPTFLWDNGGLHDGPMESLFVSVQNIANPAIGAFDNSWGGISLNDESWLSPIALPAGEATFLVQYEMNLNEDQNVDDPIYNQALSGIADPGIVWDESSGDLFSRDLVQFTVVPEPATICLLALGGLAMLRNRRRP